MNLEISHRVLHVISRIHKIATRDIDTSLTFEELGLDSFDAITLIFALEEEFNLDLSEEMKSSYNIQEVIEGIEGLLMTPEVIVA